MSDPERDAMDVRPTSDEVLAPVRAEEGGDRGRLRVYLGMAPGVGKTYKMLEEGHRRVARGTDVVVGFVEAHGRSVVAGLVDGLELIPRRRIDYRGVVVEEMDTDAILARRPTVALIDELAHTNVPGSRRPKRYEDVDVLLEAGIHVVGTMNVQHLESVADAVSTIIGAPVNERVPDEVLVAADEIELVDMSPHALRQRIKHGNVYPPERTRIALDQFFTDGNLMALRELALRYVARRVEGDLEESATGRRLPLITERVVVLVDGSPASLRAVRRAARLAVALRAAFVAAVVVTPDADRRPFDWVRDQREAANDAIDLGADLVRVEAKDLLTGLEEVICSRRATHVVLPHAETAGLRRLTEGSLPERLLRRMPELEILVVAASERGA